MKYVMKTGMTTTGAYTHHMTTDAPTSYATFPQSIGMMDTVGYTHPTSTFGTPSFMDLLGIPQTNFYRSNMSGPSYVTPPPHTMTSMGLGEDIRPEIVEEHFSEPEVDLMDVVEPDRPVRNKKRSTWFGSPIFGRKKSTTPPLEKKAKPKVTGKGAGKKAGRMTTSPERLQASEILNLCEAGDLPRLIFIPYINLDITPWFFRVLLAVDPIEYELEDVHIDCWVVMLLRSRQPDTRWTIMHTTLFPFMILPHQGPDVVVSSCNGAEGVSWRHVDIVYIPICIHPKHWVLGVFELRRTLMTIYDSGPAGTYTEPLHQHLNTFKGELTKLFRLIEDLDLRENAVHFHHRTHRTAPHQ